MAKVKPHELDALINIPAEQPSTVVRILAHYFGFSRSEAAELVNAHYGIYEARGTETALDTAKAIIAAAAK